MVVMMCTSAIAQKQFYSIETSNKQGETLVCKINGFVVLSSSKAFDVNSISIDAFLSGKNTLEITFKGKSAKSAVSINLKSIKGEENPKVTTIKVSGMNAYKTLTFTSEDSTFGVLLNKISVVKDRNQVIKYGENLLNQLKNKDITGLVKEMQPKIDDYAAIYAVSPQILEQNFLQAQSIILAKATAKTTDIKLIPMCKGKIYEIRLGNKPFFSSTDKEGGTYELPVYVAKLNGVFQIVR